MGLGGWIWRNAVQCLGGATGASRTGVGYGARRRLVPVSEGLEARRLFAGWTISGHVFDAEPGHDGPITSPLTGALVYADLNSNGVRDVGEPAALSDASGAYTIIGSGAGSFAVVEVPPAGGTHLALGETGFRNVIITDGQSITVSDFKDSQTATISGTVFEDLNNNGVQDPGEPGLAGWSLSLSTTDPDLAGVVTDANGHWSMLVPGGAYEVSLSGDPTTGTLDNWIVTTPTGGTYHAAVRGNNITGLIFGVRPKGTPGAPSPALVVPAGGFRPKLPPVVSGGEKGSVSLRVSNSGNATSTGPVPITLYASSIETSGGNQFVQLKASDLPLASFQKDLSIAPHTSRQLALDFTFPSGLPTGQYGLVAVVGPQTAVTPTVTAPNVAGEGAVRFMHRTTFTVASGTADVALSFLSTPLKLSEHRRGRAVLKIENVGMPSVTGTASLKLFASADQVLDPSDRLLAQMVDVKIRLRSGRSTRLVMAFSAPSDLAAGSYYLIASMAPSIQPPDTDPADNVAAGSIGTLIS